MINLFDAYELRARFFPAILVLSPLIIPLIPTLQILDLTFSETVYSLLVVFAVIYLWAMLLRFLSKKKEKQIWSDWGGAPSTQVMMEKNPTFGSTTKQVIREKILSEFKIEIVPGTEDEGQRITESFVIVKALFQNEKGLIFKHNCEYGFLRNLYGGYRLWWLSALVSIILSGVLVWFYTSVISIISLIISVLFLIIILLISKKELENNLKRAAFLYAETTWMRYYHNKIKK